jgi:shikimate 5-dehydrogenase
VFNRTRAKADALAAELKEMGIAGIEAAEAAALSQAEADIFINCTPQGMKDGLAPDAIGLPVADICSRNPGAAVMDTVYRPIETPLLKAAREAGLRTVDGVSMFVNQAAAQFALWTGRVPPVREFDRIVREHA